MSSSNIRSERQSDASLNSSDDFRSLPIGLKSRIFLFLNLSKSKPFFWEFIHGGLWLRPQEHMQLTAYTSVMAYSHEIISTIRITQVPSEFSCTYESYSNNNTYIWLIRSIKFVYKRSYYYIFYQSKWGGDHMLFYCESAPPKQIKKGRSWELQGQTGCFSKKQRSFCRISMECMQVVANRWACARWSTSIQSLIDFLYLTPLPPCIPLTYSRWPPWF